MEEENNFLNQQIRSLKFEIEKLNETLNNSETNEVLKEKLDYWKERSAQESQKLELLEKSIIANVEPAIIEKIFN